MLINKTTLVSSFKFVVFHFTYNGLKLFFSFSSFSLKTFEEEYVQKNVIDPEIKGTISLLKSCLKSGSVKRVVLTSTISTLTGKDADGERRRIVDESCQTFVDQVWKNKASGWVNNVSYD